MQNTLNRFGRRLSVTTQKGGTESYGYDNAGRLISTSKDGKSVEQRIYDLAGRMVGQRNYNNEGNLEQSQKIHYNNIGQQIQQYYYNGSNTQTAKVRFQLDAEGNNLSHLQHGYGEDGIYISTATYYRHEYQKYDTYKEWRTTASTIWYQNNLPITWGQTRYSLDNTGNTLAVSVHNDLNKAQALVVDSLGRIRQKVAGIDIAADYEGQIQGTLAQTNTMRSSSFEQIPGGTDSYGQSTSAGLALKADTRLRSQHFLYAPNNSPIADYGRITPQANFGYMDTGVTDNVSNTQGQYTINLGDSLISIAQQIYGDASLWYLLADANRLVGIDPNQKAQIGGVLTDANGATIGTTLSPGQVLILPNKPINLSNNSSTFKTYNPASIIGDTSPTIPSPPPPKQCGKIGQIIMIVVAIIVTVVLAYYAPSTLTWWGGVVKAMLIGAAASLASQAVGVMIGAIDKINWKQVAIAGVAAGVTAGVGNLGNAWVFGSTTATAMANAAISSALTQGINIMTGQQQRFNWRSVATAAVAAGAMDALDINGNMGKEKLKNPDGSLKIVDNVQQYGGVTNWGERAVYWFGSSFVNTASEYLVNRISNAPDDQRRNFGRSWGNGIVSAASADIAHSIGDAYAADKKYINPNDPNDQGYHTAGGILKHYLSHALLGGARAALMGDSFGSGALGGLTQAVIGDLVPDEFVKGTGGIGVNADGKRDTSGDWVDRFLRQSSSTVVGLSASWLAEEVGGDGAAAQGAAQNGWENNELGHDDSERAKYKRRTDRYLLLLQERGFLSFLPRTNSTNEFGDKNPYYTEQDAIYDMNVTMPEKDPYAGWSESELSAYRPTSAGLFSDEGSEAAKLHYQLWWENRRLHARSDNSLFYQTSVDDTMCYYNPSKARVTWNKNTISQAHPEYDRQYNNKVAARRQVEQQENASVNSGLGLPLGSYFSFGGGSDPEKALIANDLLTAGASLMGGAWLAATRGGGRNNSTPWTNKASTQSAARGQTSGLTVQNARKPYESSPPKISMEMQQKILYGQRRVRNSRLTGDIIGAHSGKISNNHGGYAVEEVVTYRDGTRKVKMITQFADGRLSNVKTSTLFPSAWSDKAIISAVQQVAKAPPVARRSSDGSSLHQAKVKGVWVEVIKNTRGEVTAGYPCGAGCIDPAAF